MDKIKVVVRMRPMNERETLAGQSSAWSVSQTTVSLAGSDKPAFAFDAAFSHLETTRNIFDSQAKDLIDDCCEGINATVFAYGQTSSGKTFTMSGDKNAPGIISLAINHIFARIAKSTDLTYTVKVSYLEIYNEVVNDLLSPGNINLKIHEHMTRGVHVGGLTETLANSPDHVAALISKGEANRHFGATNMNERSSRSHTILRILIQSQRKESVAAGKQSGIRVSCLNLVDLAGSERAAHTGAEGKRLKEGGSINKSLLALTNVIEKLSKEGSDRGHIPFRNSKITRILQPSLGGNARTLIICTVTPSTGFIDETISTLKFASRAKSIRNKPTVNELVSDHILLKQYRARIEGLVNELNLYKSGGGGSNGGLGGVGLSPMVVGGKNLTFMGVDEFRQSYPLREGGGTPVEELMLCGGLSAGQCEDVKQAMRAANQLLKRVTGVRALVVEGKTRMLSVLQDLRYREATREAQVKVVLEGVAGYVNRLQKESRKWENLFGSECIVRKEVEARLVEEMGIRERLSTVVAEEREERQVLSGELTAVKSVQSQLSEKLADLVETCAIQFELSPEIVEELRGLLAALTLSPGDCAVGDFLNVLEDLKEGEIKKVYNELRGSFEEGKQALIEEAGHKAMLLDRAMEKQRNLEASVVALEKGLETRAGELRESQRTIDNLTELLHTGEAKAQDLEAARKADKAAYESEKVLVNRKLFDFAKCLMETFEFTEEAEEAEAIQTEFMRYFDAGNPNVSSDKFSALLEGCKSLAEDKVRKELKCLSDEGVDQVVRAGRLREEALLNQIKEMKESFSSLTEENESMKERYDALKTSNQSLLARLDISLSECKASQEENAFLRKEAELLRKQTEASSISACELNDLKTSLRMLVKTCSSKLSLGDEVEEAFETALETAISFGADYDWDTSSVVKALCDMKEYQTLTMESDMKSQFNVERSKLLKEIASQAELLDKFQRDVQLKETTNQVIQRDKDRYQQNLEEVQTRAAMLENELSEAKKTSSAAERKSKKLQTSLKELEVQHTQTLTEHSQLEQDHKALLNQLNECQIELEHAKNSRGAGLMDETIFMQLQQAVEQKHQQLQALENEYRSLHANYSLVQSESQDLNSALAMMEMEKSHAVQELETLTERVNELEQEIEEARMQDEFLRARLAIFESQSLTEGSDSAGGNTLLSEVEDRRIKSECKFREMLKTLRTQNQEISQLKREKKELKNQLSLIDSTSHGLSEEQLKQHLSLISNVISGIKNRGDANDSSLTSQIGEEMNAEAYDLLKLELHEKILENEGLRREIRGLRIISLNEMSKVRTAEYSLSQHGRKVQQAESTISILKDKLSAKDCVEVEDVEMEVDDEEVFEVAKPEVKEKENKPKRDVLLPIALTNVIQTPIVQLQKQEQQQNAPINPNSRREKAAQKHKQVNVKNEEASDPNSCKTQ